MQAVHPNELRKKSIKNYVEPFFEKRENIYSLWSFEFKDVNNYNSIELVNSARYEIV